MDFWKNSLCRNCKNYVSGLGFFNIADNNYSFFCFFEEKNYILVWVK